MGVAFHKRPLLRNHIFAIRILRDSILDIDIDTDIDIFVNCSWVDTRWQ
jgi:hypothetical protein